MAVKLPAILSRAASIPGVEEVGAGVIVDSKPDALARAILGLVDDPQRRRQIGQKGRELVLEMYTWDKVATGMKHAYEMILSGTLNSGADHQQG